MSRARNPAAWLLGIGVAVSLAGPRDVLAGPDRPHASAAAPATSTTAAASGPWRVRLQSGVELDPSRWSTAAEAVRDASGRSGPVASLVFYGEADPARVRQEIAAAGGRIVAYVPDRTFLVRWPAGVATTLGAGVRVADWQDAFKVDPRWFGARTRARVATVVLFDDAAVERVADAARAAGADVITASSGASKLLRVRADDDAIATLARRSDVAWIEPHAAPVALNDQAQGLVQTGVIGNRRLWDLGLRGQGEVVMSADQGFNTNHVQFQDPAVPITGFGDFPSHRKVIAYRRAGADPRIAFGDHGDFHGTHTAGTIAGSDDWIAGSPFDGMAKDARLFVVDMSGPSVGDTMLTPADLDDLFAPGYAGNAGGAPRISSNSWGSPAEGAYTVEAEQLDRFVWTHPDFLVLVAAGNDGSPGTTYSPGTAKNCITVGATWNGPLANTLSALTSRGPTRDGRRKPTLCAPGQRLVSSTTSTATYDLEFGTSMATAAAAGCVTLLREYVEEGWYPTGAKTPANGFAPSAALLKAMAVNAGTNVVTAFNAPDTNIGWGRIDADSVLYVAGDTRRLLLVDQRAGLGHGAAIEVQVNVVDSNEPLEVTLCWMDYPGSPLAAATLVNDLDLVVTNGTATYRGNVFNGGLSVTGGATDRLNVEEGVRIASPGIGVWTVRVEGANVPFGPQPYGLVVTGGVGTTAGSLTLDRASYGSGAAIRLRVVDTDAGSSLPVTIRSTRESVVETVTLTGANGVVTGSIPTTAGAPVPDGVLSVGDGDVITATYHDASTDVDVVATARVNTTAPALSNVRISDAGNGAVRVAWTTDTNASSRVDFGPSPALGESQVDSVAVFEHAVVVSGLDVGRRYYFDIASTDLEGNVARDDNGGQHHAFTTAIPSAFAIGAAVPNPLSGAGTVSYSLPRAADVRLDVCDVGGRRVRSLVRGLAGPGTFVATWDRRDEHHDLVAAGVYYYVFVVSGETHAKRVVVLE